jgi:hypothetical protein
VGKFADKTLSEKILGFIQEGVRFAFQGNHGVEDNLILGSRLPFLTVLSR